MLHEYLSKSSSENKITIQMGLEITMCTHLPPPYGDPFKVTLYLKRLYKRFAKRSTNPPCNKSII